MNMTNSGTKYKLIDNINNIEVYALEYGAIGTVYCTSGRIYDSITNEPFDGQFMEYISFFDENNNLLDNPVIHNGIWKEQ